IAVGDLLAFRGKNLTNIHVADCTSCVIDSVTIRSSGGFCVHEDGGDGGNRYTVTVTYGPRPEGATENPLIACNADAFHSSIARKGPTLIGCKFEGMCDDGIAIHGAFALALEARGNTVVTTERGDWRVGDHVQFFDLKGGLTAEATITAIRAKPDYKPSAKSRYRPYEDLARRRFSELDLDRPVGATFDWLVSNRDTNGSGFMLKDNLIRNHRARGMLLKADDGVVENNTVDGSTIAGIVLSPEFWWNEAGCSRNVLIKGNTIRNTGYATHVGPGQRQAGALTLCGEAEPDARPGHRNIRIENNTFRDCEGTNILIDFAMDVKISGNTFVNPMRTPVKRGADHIEDLGALIYVGPRTFEVHLKDNVVNNPGLALVREVGVARTAGNVTGIKPDRK
ncbi:MAG TPA: right-handed parallel beta-helix repeat-containing protein, partial [Planctomycetota bacterium]|nr:right-handed parallel beta-helix repeat-containing protein [Planctomycetota bacterium]